jgi:hypothetical protein
MRSRNSSEVLFLDESATKKNGVEKDETGSDGPVLLRSIHCGHRNDRACYREIERQSQQKAQQDASAMINPFHALARFTS